MMSQPSHSQNTMSQLSRLLALRAILKKLFHSSPGCWLSGPYSKKYFSALQAAGSLSHSQKIMSQLSRLLALRAILKKLFHSSPGCWLSGPYSKKYFSALQAAGSLSHSQKIMSQLSRLLALGAMLKYTTVYKCSRRWYWKPDLRYPWSHSLT